MKRTFGKAKIVGEDELRRPAPKNVGGLFFARFNSASRKSVILAAKYVGCTERERFDLLEALDLEVL